MRDQQNRAIPGEPEPDSTSPPKRRYSAPAVLEDVLLESQSLACAGSKSDPGMGCDDPLTS